MSGIDLRFAMRARRERRAPFAAVRAAIIVASMAVVLASCAPSVDEVARDLSRRSPGDIYREASERLAKSGAGGRIERISWSEKGDRLDFTRGGERWSFDLEARRLAPADEQQQERSRAARPGRGRQHARATSPDGAWDAVCRDFNVVLEKRAAPAENGAVDGDAAEAPGASAGQEAPSVETFAVTTSGHRKLRYGMASWVYGEELAQQEAMWWSSDSRYLVYYEFDEREVPDFFLVDGWSEQRTSVLTEGYPKPGDPNPRVRLFVYDVVARETRPIAFEEPEGEPWYLYGVRFSPTGELVVLRTNREQNVLHLEAANVATGAVRRIVTETQGTWQNNRPELRLLADGGLVWETERDGAPALELRGAQGEIVVRLSGADEGPIVDLVQVDETGGAIYYTAHGGRCPLDEHLYRVGLDGTGRRRLTSEEASHTVAVSPDGRWFVTRAERADLPPQTTLHSTSGEWIATLTDRERALRRAAQSFELFTFTAADGTTALWGSLARPADFDARARYPLLVEVYGGPESQSVQDRFRAGHPACALGFLVARFDNRGTSGRSKGFLSAVHRRLGIVDLDDQAAGVRHLVERPYVDGSRVGIYGHSYGGYLAALALLRYPDLFHVAVAGSPVTDWRNYDSIYTERYMGLPAENREGYDAGSCIVHAANLRGKLLLQHGLLDDNVHPNNTFQLVAALRKAGRTADVNVYADQGHGLGSAAFDAQWAYLYRWLIEAPAEGARRP